ncbi:diphthine--ammonia ligase [Pontibacillus yanchengensis]|uniref:Diphthine--ammonia ligase n=2 Tax=Pontibacillus yanchengensis TaxID=462910 RepID=A0ACC7VFW9_9BACI|nr:diphthine--ammonia ligase [Pontibacillus yanchengensis]MYL32473.1 diphthine--ammonia ligase [Pontibacillus yanchengensis]MYL53054.1 diphthine--ammonia ligase [Pontibacillus yanchengensis]
MKNVIVSWSGGKDSAFVLFKLMRNGEYIIKGLLSTTSEETKRLPIHEVSTSLIQEQATSIGLPLFEVSLPSNANNDLYKKTLKKQFDQFKNNDVYTIIYADLFLEDIKVFRDQLLSEVGMIGEYPLWGRNTSALAEDFISKGFEAIVTTIDAEKLPSEMVGKLYNKSFLENLPEGVDPCGENGEFHTFVFNGPLFQYSIPFSVGETFETVSGRFLHVEIHSS